MKRKQSLIFVFICVYLSTCLYGQNWSGIIDPTRAIDWSTKGVSGGVVNRSAVCASLTPSNTLAQINSAIASCPSGQVVSLAAGTYNLAGGIVDKGVSGITIRGAGPDQTFLVFSAPNGCIGLGGADICVENSTQQGPANPDNIAAWTAGYSQGTTSITLNNIAKGSISNLQVGGILVLDQLDDSNADNGQLWMCSTIGVCSQQGNSNIERSGRGQGQTVVVTSITGSGPWNVGITPGLNMPNWRSGQSPGAYWASSVVSGVGIENLSVDNTNSSATGGILFNNTMDSWVKNIRSMNSNRNHIWGYDTCRLTIRDSYFYGTQNAQSQSYGLETDVTSDWLVENNVFQHVTAPAPAGEQVSGVVYGYNYAVDDYYVVDLAWQMAGSFNHSEAINYNLMESNDGPGFTADDIHGTSHFQTTFRNHWTGRDTAITKGVPKTQQTDGVIIYANNRYYNFIGNVLGTSGFHTTYECYAASSTGSCSSGTDLSIYMLGFSGNNQQSSPIPNDQLVRNTMMRWGNYDTVNASSRFVGAEVPSGISTYGNAVPTSQNLPASFYYNVQPSWWSFPSGNANTPWPAIGPDVTGGNIANLGGHAYLIPAANCYLNVMGGKTDGSSGVLSFNANNCYGNTPPPAPPTNLTTVVH